MAKKKKNKAPQEFSPEPARELLEKAEKLAGWVDAAFQHSADFPPQVVLTVVGDYLVQWADLGPELKKAADGVVERRETLSAKAGELKDQAKEVEALVDELKLRHLIGELAADDYDARVAEARGGVGDEALSGVEGEIADLDALIAATAAITARLDAAEQRRAGLESGDPIGPPPAAEPEVPSAEPEPPPAEPQPEAMPVSEEPPPSESAVEAPASAPDGEEWDVPPAVASEAVPAADAPSASISGEPAPASEAAPDVPAWTPLGAPVDGGGDAGTSAGDDLLSTGLITAQPGLAAAAVPSEPAAPPESGEGVEGPRLAVFSPDGKQEIYPFGGEVMSMGRGRNNDIQIKNDGKISRYHCRIFRRGDEFIIEDNKSSNGTLVDSKLVTRQRLDGGEQIQIGETRVIFQL